MTNKITNAPDVYSFWKNEIQKTLDPIQKEVGNLTYYVFQTPCHFQPKLLIVGINPGGDYNDGKSCFDRENNWYTQCKKDSQASCSFNETICSVFGYGQNEKLWNLLENAVGMNKIHFNTGSVEKLNNLTLKKQIERVCGQFTRTLIDDYIQPKQILAIGLDTFNHLKNKSVEILQQGDIVVQKSYRGNIPIYYIPNPSRINQKYYNNGKVDQYRQILENELLNHK